MVVNKGKQSSSINKSDLQQAGGSQQSCQDALLARDSIPTYIFVRRTVYPHLCLTQQFPIFQVVEQLNEPSEWQAGRDGEDFSQAQPASRLGRH